MFAFRTQNFQDWFTQQWVILLGRRIEPEAVPWLMGPFGIAGSKADEFVYQLAMDEGLIIERSVTSRGLISSIQELNLSAEESARISQEVVDFYENTSMYDLKISVQWNPFFKPFGALVNSLFSKRIRQLHIPGNTKNPEHVKSEIITLSYPESKHVKYTVWYRTLQSTGEVLYSGVYSTCKLPSGEVCIKAVFPLPNGNATVLMSPRIGKDGELNLESSGKKFGDTGFYFLLNDSKRRCWSQYISSFKDHLVVSSDMGNISAKQTLTLWSLNVLQFKYEINRVRKTS